MIHHRFDINRLNVLPIKDVAKRLGLQLQKNKCLCFLHEENTPSFSVDPKKNIWKCFGCGEGGGVIKLVEKYNECDFIDACKWLENAFGIAPHSLKQSNIVRRKNVKKESDIQPNTEIYQWFFENLSVTEGVRNFIEDRKYPDNVILQYNLKGIDDCTAVFNKCKTRWGIEKLVKCGLAMENVSHDTGEITYKFTWWTNTLLIPFYNNKSNIVYIQGRTLNPRYESKYKYVNLSKIETFIFNLPILQTLAKSDSLVITEGVTDCISCCLMGKKAIGIIGAHGFKNEYVQLLKDFEICVIPDNDTNRTGHCCPLKVVDVVKS